MVFISFQVCISLKRATFLHWTAENLPLIVRDMSFLPCHAHTDFGDPGANAMACFLIMAVAPLNRRWLYMEQTAHSASERLSDLTSKEGDSFIDELCTMSGNVQQVVEALEFCMQVRGGRRQGRWEGQEGQVGGAGRSIT